MHAGTYIFVRSVDETELLIELVLTLSGKKTYHYLVTGLKLRSDKFHNALHEHPAKSLTLVFGQNYYVCDIYNIAVIPDNSSYCYGSSFFTDLKRMSWTPSW